MRFFIILWLKAFFAEKKSSSNICKKNTSCGKTSVGFGHQHSRFFIDKDNTVLEKKINRFKFLHILSKNMHFFVDWLGKCEHTFWHITRVEHTRYLMFISHVFAFLTQSRKLLLFKNSFANERLRQNITYSSLKPIKNNCLNRGSRGTWSLISSLIIIKFIWNSDP